MDCFEIKGGSRLEGEIEVHSAKNSVLPILAGAVLINGETVIHNCPELSDVKVTVDILKSLGAKVKKENKTLIIDAQNINCSEISCDMMRSLRSSILFLGALLSRMKEAKLSFPGGCDIGLRPIDLHLYAIETLGYSCKISQSGIECFNKGAKSADIYLDFPSVGATENAILSSVFLSGKTKIINAAREPEIEDLINFLNEAGADIRIVSPSVIEINGVQNLYSCSHRVIPDRIEAVTFMCCAAITSGDLLIKNVNLSHIKPNLPQFYEMGCKLTAGENSIRIKAPKKLKRVREIQTGAYPLFPTDTQTIITSPLCLADGKSKIIENIFENRFKHIGELKKFGADVICSDSRVAVISGVEKLHSAKANCTDLRGGAAVLIASLAAEGTSLINNIHHIDRGYERIEESLNSIGADITRIKNEEQEEKN